MPAIEEFNRVRNRAKSAVFSPCKKYRYALTRNWDVDSLFGVQSKPIVFIGLNPSTADEVNPDNTITRLVGFAQGWDYSGLIMLNLFAWRETDRMKMIREVKEPIGEENDAVIRHVCSLGYDVCACWGADGDHMTSRVDPTVADMMLVLGGYQHWTIKTVNRAKIRRGYSCTIWHDGHRVTGQSQDVIGAVNVAVNKIKDLTAVRTGPPGSQLTVYSGDESDEDD
jgi:hypothetical protein